VYASWGGLSRAVTTGGEYALTGRSILEINAFETQNNRIGYRGKESQRTQSVPFNHDYRAQLKYLTFHANVMAKNVYKYVHLLEYAGYVLIILVVVPRINRLSRISSPPLAA
jgi:hypothetical protein